MGRSATEPHAPEAVDRLLRGLLAAIDRHGPRKVSISDICAEANVSRGTFYRYFAGRDEILAALADHALGLWRRELAEAVAADPALSRRFRVVHDASVGYLGHRIGVRRIFRTESEVAVEFLEAHWASLVASVDAVVRPAFRGAGAAARSRTAADAFMRLLVADLLVGPPDEATVRARVDLLQAHADGP